ncbi:MAG: lipocalin family protein [Pseudomonadota bacterium]
MRQLRSPVFVVAGALLATACAGPTTISAVKDVDLERFDGTWYDVASFPQSFQDGCHCTTATYTLRDNGEVGVLNRCRKGSVDGELSEATARAYLPDPDKPGELKVEFLWPFAADYWVIDLGTPDVGEYTHAVVSEPGQQYLWILSRAPEMNRTTYDEILGWLVDQGFDTGRLQAVEHQGCPSD